MVIKTSPTAGDVVHLREMTAADLPAAHRLSRGEKWPHRLEDWEYMFHLGQGFVAQSDGKVAGTIMVWPYGDGAATLGMVIVSPTCRGQGLGRKLMTAALERMGGRAVKLNATPDGLALYESLGFAATGAIMQHQGTAAPVPIVELGPVERVRPMGAGDADTIIALDRRSTGLARDALISDLMENARGIVLDRDEEAVGFALFRRFGLGYSIGPTVAPDAQGAKALIAYWLSLHTGMFVRLDVPEDSGLSPWLEQNGMLNVGRVVTMVKGDWPVTTDGSFSIVSQALG